MKNKQEPDERGGRYGEEKEVGGAGGGRCGGGNGGSSRSLRKGKRGRLYHFEEKGRNDLVRMK